MRFLVLILSLLTFVSQAKPLASCTPMDGEQILCKVRGKAAVTIIKESRDSHEHQRAVYSYTEKDEIITAWEIYFAEYACAFRTKNLKHMKDMETAIKHIEGAKAVCQFAVNSRSGTLSLYHSSQESTAGVSNDL